MQIRDGMRGSHATLFDKQPMSYQAHRQDVTTQSPRVTPGGHIEKK